MNLTLAHVPFPFFPMHGMHPTSTFTSPLHAEPPMYQYIWHLAMKHAQDCFSPFGMLQHCNLVRLFGFSLEGERKRLNRDEYLRTFTPCISMKPSGFVIRVSRETGLVIINNSTLVETLMNSNRWAEMFPCMIARTSTTDVISSGMGGTKNGALQLMHAEL